MANVPIGQQNHDGSRTPTLREFIKSGRTTPRNCEVQIVFKPNKTPAYGIVAYPGFRISIDEGTELFDAIDNELQQWIQGESYLVICPDSTSPGKFTLEIDTDESAEWKEYDWGYKLTGREKPKSARSKKKPTDVRHTNQT